MRLVLLIDRPFVLSANNNINGPNFASSLLASGFNPAFSNTTLIHTLDKASLWLSVECCIKAFLS